MNLTPTKTYNAQTGNLASKAGVTYTYADTAHKHAVTSLSNGNAYTYDANGNQTKRITSNGTYDLTYDGENRLVSVIKDSSTVASFVYNGDGARVQSTLNGVVTAFVGNRLEWSGSATTMKKYYYAGSQRVAMRTGSSTLNFILGDHLGSTSLTTSGTGAYQSETLYKPWGEVRYSSGTLPTKYTFTGQYSNVSDFGLMYYGARWYDVSLGRFASADTIIPQPGNPQSWDRYAYTLNSPLMYTDPSGHWMCGDAYDSGCAENSNEFNRYRAATNRDIARQDYIFSLIFSGSNNGTWTSTDWDYYYTNRDEIWGGQLKWMNNLEDPSGLAGFSIHVQRLSLHYSSEDKTLFVQDFGLFWGGIPYNANWTKSAIQVVHGPVLPHFYESNDGMDSRYIDSINSDESQAHHYAGLFFLGYFAGSGIAGMVNFGRDGVNLAILDLQLNLGDVYLGDVAASDGMHFALTGQPNDLSMMISNLSNYQGFIEYGAQYRPR